MAVIEIGGMDERQWDGWHYPGMNETGWWAFPVFFFVFLPSTRPNAYGVVLGQARLTLSFPREFNFDLRTAPEEIRKNGGTAMPPPLVHPCQILAIWPRLSDFSVALFSHAAPAERPAITSANSIGQLALPDITDDQQTLRHSVGHGQPLTAISLTLVHC